MNLARLLAALPVCVSIALAQSGPVLSASGTVRVNGVQVSSAAVVNGNSVEVGDNSFASLTEPGSNVVIANKSSGTVDAHKLVLNRGSVSVKTTNGYSVRAGIYTIAPQAASAHYDVARIDCRVAITAHDIALSVSDGTVVNAKHSVTRVEPNCAATNDTPPAAGTATGAATYTPDKVIVGGAAVGGSALAAYLTSGVKSSPSFPRR